MPEGLRNFLSPITTSAGRKIGKYVKDPNVITAIGFVFGAFSGLFVYYKMLLLSALFLIISGLFDMLDGAVARALNKVTKRGAFIDSNLDRLVEASLYGGIIASNSSLAVYSFLAFAFSMMVSYSRARVEGLSKGARPKSIEIGERGVRLAVMILALILNKVFYGLLIVIALALETFLERFIVYYRYLSETNLS